MSGRIVRAGHPCQLPADQARTRTGGLAHHHRWPSTDDDCVGLDQHHRLADGPVGCAGNRAKRDHIQRQTARPGADGCLRWARLRRRRTPEAGQLEHPGHSRGPSCGLVRRSPGSRQRILSNRWISWRLHDGRYVHVWSAGASVDELTTFAGDLAERNQVLPRRIVLGVTLPGLTAESVHHGNDPAALNLDQITLCPTTQSPQDQSEQAVNRCLMVGIAHGESIDQSIGMMGGGVETLTVGAQKIYTAGNSAYVHVDNKNGPFGINVWSPDQKPQDLALIASSVRFDPTMATGS